MKIIKNNIKTVKYIDYIFIFLFILIISFPRSFSEIKILPLIICLIFSLSIILRKSKIYKVALIFYGSQWVICLVWVFIGYINGNNSVALMEALRLYLLWGFIFFILVHGMANININFVILKSVIISSYLIIFTSIILIIDGYFGLDIFSYKVRDELNFLIGFHDGYIQIALHSTASLFFITPFLLTYLLARNIKISFSSYFLVFILLVLVALSGRRALWLIVGFFLIIFIFKKYYHSFYLLPLLTLIFTLFFIINFDFLSGTLEYLLHSFSSDDERTIQNSYLIDKFTDSPFLGKGIGFEASYIRNYERPWLFESTYHTLLASLGVIGFLCLFINIFILLIYNLYKSFILNKPFLISIIFGVFGLIISAYSNPYFGSFDFLFYLSFIPLIYILNENNFNNY